MKLSLPAAIALALGCLPTPPHATIPGDPPQDLRSTWEFALGRPSERLVAAASDMPAPSTGVTLPHRLAHPDTALWYSRTLDFPANASLLVDADDGAQVFVDGERWDHDRRTFFAARSLAAGPHRVIVRVLNNAMHGGLRRLAFAAAPQLTRYVTPSPRPIGFDAPDSPAFRARMPGPAEPCRFALWADSQGGWKTFASLVARMRERPLHFSAGAGDLVNDGSDPRAWTAFTETLAPLAARVPIVPVAGNHDYDGFYNDLRPRGYIAQFGYDRTWFSWSCGPARFAAIDINREFPVGISAGTSQHEWLQREAASVEWRTARWRVLLVHQPPFSRSWAGYDGDESVRRIVERLAAGSGIDLVVAGHSHAYEHLVRSVAGRPVHVLITGGAGGGLEEPLARPVALPDRVILAHHFVAAEATGHQLTFEAIGVDGQLLDRWSIAR